MIPPESYTLDQILLERPGNDEIQLDLFLDYQNNVTLYPAFQAYLDERQPPLLAIWGKNDTIFVPEGATAYKRVVKDAKVHLVDGGHFALEAHLEEISEAILAFLEKKIDA